MVLIALLLLADPADARPNVGGRQAPALRVAVLPTSSATLPEDEAALLTQLLAIRVERSGIEVIAVRGCAEPACLAQVAAAEQVDGVFLAEHGKLGNADVLTIHLFDVVAARTYRDATSSTERGAFAEALGPVVEGMMARLTAALPPLRQPVVRARYEQAHVEVRADEGGWWFVDGTGRALTENEFVRRYRNQTQRRNLDDAEVDREPDMLAWTLTIGGIAAGVAALGLTLYFTTTPEGQALANASDDAWIIVPALGMTTALAATIYGLLELGEGRINDGNELDHVLTLEQGRAAAAIHNEALLERLRNEPAQTGL